MSLEIVDNNSNNDVLSGPVKPLGVSYDPDRDMELLAQGKLDSPELLSLDGQETDRQMKLFLVSQAKHELNKVVRYTQFLDTIEDKFMKQVENRLQERPNDLLLMTSAIEVVQKSLARSNDLINQIIKDDSLKTLVVNMPVTNSFNQKSVVSNQLDASSRDKIRNTASQLLDFLTQVEDSSTQAVNITDSSPE